MPRATSSAISVACPRLTASLRRNRLSRLPACMNSDTSDTSPVSASTLVPRNCTMCGWCSCLMSLSSVRNSALATSSWCRWRCSCFMATTVPRHRVRITMPNAPAPISLRSLSSSSWISHAMRSGENTCCCAAPTAPATWLSSMGSSCPVVRSLILPPAATNILMMSWWFPNTAPSSGVMPQRSHGLRSTPWLMSQLVTITEPSLDEMCSGVRWS
mmetsp:Transcript_22195/g.54937  ORF Transcript_22195/g.54937 Transcript_22195/m.54937 type:complete len:215 (-) Transcript_22195:752-1396(-)